ncbi:MAG: hypothetical protein M5U28_10145 [Sandaracinaceae bacterium]|nr:hypothetical protein [Sandaracinaceae bacterium]
MLLADERRVDVAEHLQRAQDADLALGRHQVAERARAQVEARVEHVDALHPRGREAGEVGREVAGGVHAIGALDAPLAEGAADGAAAEGLDVADAPARHA